LGIKQESYFVWHTGGKLSGKRFKDEILPSKRPASFGAANSAWTDYPAFTVAELGEMLPMSLQPKKSYEYFLEIGHDSYGWSCVYRFYEQDGSNLDFVKIIFSETEADARAKMLIYLLGNNLINLK
jgi:hypothetical protein